MLKNVDTRYGTNSTASLSKGNTLPYTGVPFGNHYLAVQTQAEETSWWFNPYSHSFQGFRITHQPSPWMGDFSHFLITPFTGPAPTKLEANLTSSYSTQEASFKPHHINIYSNRYQVEMTATMGQHSFMISSNSDEKISYRLTSHKGFCFKKWDSSHIYFEVCNVSGCEDPNFKMYGVIKNHDYTIKNHENGDCFLESNSCNDTLTGSLSFISYDQAIFNLNQSPSDFKSFEGDNQNQWLKYFNKFEIEHKNTKEKDTFANMIYRSFLFPMRFYERDHHGKPYHYNTSAKKIQEGILYTNNGFWDTYKTVYPLFSLVAVDMFEEMLEGFLNSYKNSGYLPKWLSPDERGLMPGTLIDAVIADAASKNIASEIMPQLFEAMLKSASTQSDNPNYGRRLTHSYLKYGYVPNTVHESVNQTLDNAYSDYCISIVAQKTDNETLVPHFENSSLNYKNLFDAETGFMRGKNENGEFSNTFDPITWGGDYTEGSAWQNSFGVYHDIQGLINLYPSNKDFIIKINELVNQKPHFNVGSYGFEIHEITEVAIQKFGQMAISNQPSFHLPYLFTYANRQESTQVLLRHLMKECFSPTFEAYPGDEDNGSMSAWYLFNALGFYPLTPGSGEYVLGIPLLDKATVHLSSGNSLSILTKENYNHKNFVIDRKVNSHTHRAAFITHDSLIKGMNIETVLGIVPNLQALKADEMPFSISKKNSDE